MKAHEEIMMLTEAERWGDVETELTGASSAELYKLWQDAAYLKERARFLLSTRHGVTLP